MSAGALVQRTAVIVAICAASLEARADSSCADGMDVLLLLDRSGSMTPHWQDATASVNSIVTAFAVQHAFGLMLFPDGACSVTKIEVPIGYGKQTAIANEMAATTPDGMTPLSEALELAKGHFRSLSSGRPQATVVITDGVETCAAADAPARVAGELFAEGVKVFVIGIKVTAAQLDAIASAGGTGNAAVVDDGVDISESLDVILDLCCGNGELDPGETCDKAIAPGAPDACPASCDDGDPCTADRLSCKKGCDHRPVIGTKEDGCCRGGDAAELDPDCTALYGNGVVDGVERCDTAIPGGDLGACNCDDDDPCTDDATRGCYRSCYHTPREPDPTLADGCCPESGMAPSSDIDCTLDEPDAAPDAAPADAGHQAGSGDRGGCAVTGAPHLPWIALLVLLSLLVIRSPTAA